MRAFDRALKRLGMRRRKATPATSVDLKVNRRGRRHWTAGVSVAAPESGHSYADEVASIAVAHGYPASQPLHPETAELFQGYPAAGVMPPELYPVRRGRGLEVRVTDLVGEQTGSVVEVSGCGDDVDGSYRIAIVHPGGRVLELEPIEDVTVSCGRPISDYARPVEPETPQAEPVPFDPVRAWADVALAWLRCAHTVAEIPAQLALYHRVRVVGLH